MSDWWLDESRPVGPYQDNGFTEVFQAFIDNAGLALQPYVILSKQFGKMVAAMDFAEQSDYTLMPPVYYRTLDEIESEKQREKDAFAKADAAANVPSGTFEGLAAKFGDISERTAKRQIGRGNISGHGPRSKTTFGHNGRKKY